MKYRILISLAGLFLLNGIFNTLSAQVNKNGNPLMFSYDYSQTGGSEWNYGIIKDDRGIMYFGNEIQGVLEYDGKNWNSIRINDNPVILALEKDNNGVLYVSGPYEFGYIEPDSNGKQVYTSLSSRLDSAAYSRLGDVYDIQLLGEDLYFVCKRAIYTYNYRSDKLSSLNIDSDRFFTMQRLFSVDEKLFVADNREGLTVMSGDSITLLPGGEFFGRDYCFAVMPYENDWLVVGTYFKGLLMYNYTTGEIREDFISGELNDELKAGQIYNGSVLPDGNYALGTMRAGVFIFNRDGLLAEKYSNESLGLHDDQIYTTYNDGSPKLSSQLWMSVVEKIYRISYNLPVRFYDDRNNITFPIRAISEFNNGIYVGGDKGIARMITGTDNVSFIEIDGITSQTFSILPFSAADGREYLLAATLDDLYIIDENENISNFIDILVNPTDDLNADFIHCLHQSGFTEGLFYIGLNTKLRIIEYTNGRWKYIDAIKGFPGRVQYIVEESESRFWVSTIDMDKLFTVDFTESDTVLSEYTGDEIINEEIKSIKKIDNSVVLVTDKSIYKYNHELESFEEDEKFILEERNDVSYEDVSSLGDYGYLVTAFDTRNFDYLVKPDGSKVMDIFYLLPKTYTARLLLKDNMLWLPKQQEIYLLDLDRIDEFKYENDVLIRKVIIGGDSIIFNGTFYEKDNNGRLLGLLKDQPKTQVKKINHSLNDITFHWSSNNYLSENTTIYQYMIEGFDEDWSKWEIVNYKDYTNLQHGKYKFKIRARGEGGQITEETVFEFEILRAWYQSVIALIIYVILIVLVVVAIIKVYTRRLINENVRLEGIVAERTKEVVRQKEELEASIHYASRIQRAILPSEKTLKEKVEEYFILFRPRDIVSGDFYWVSEKGSRLFIVAADCTGHGVPGAFMSILGISFLDEIVNKADNTETDKILNALRKHVTDSLKQMEESIEETKDGMDLGILVVNYDKNEIEYSGAYNPCWMVRELTRDEKDLYLENKLELERSSLTNGEYILTSIDADRMPIGISSRMDQPFKMHKQKMEKGVSYYLLSDGYSDQFGGEDGRKFLKKNLKKLILEVQGLPMKQQHDLLEKRLLDWMGEYEQVDDILIMGVRVI